MVRKVNHKELNEVIKGYYNSEDKDGKKPSLFVWGRFGIGKSAVVREVAKEIAIKKKKEFLDWNRTTPQQKKEIFENPEKYFVLIDIRLSEYDSSDIKGLPIFQDNKKSIEFRIPYWALLLENEKSDGILFFDEINLSTPLVISSCYKIIYDKVINDGRINNNWLVMGAGNTSEDRAYIHDIAPPLLDRGGEVELNIPISDEVIDWDIKNNIDSRIIGFKSFKNSVIYKVDFNDNQKFTTPRGWERVSNLIKGKTNYDEIELLVSSAISEGIAQEFIAFCKIKDKIDLDDLIKNPKGLKDIEDISIKYFLTTAIADKYREEKLKFKKVLEISKVLDEIENAEFVALLWRMCYAYNEKFKEEFLLNVDNKMADKYSKYLI